MKIYGHPVSRSFRVYWTCFETATEFDMDPIKPADAKQRKDYLAINPSAKVPSLVDGDFALFESAAICSYICQKSPQQSLLPAEGTQQRALVEQWLFFACAELEQPLWVSSKHQFMLPDMYRSQEVEPSCKYEFDRQLNVLSHFLGKNEFLLGDQFTLADLFVSHVLMWAHTKGYDDLKHKNITDFTKRMRRREGFLKTKELVASLKA